MKWTAVLTWGLLLAWIGGAAYVYLVAPLVHACRRRQVERRRAHEVPQFTALVKGVRGRWEHEHVPHPSKIAVVAFFCQLTLGVLVVALWLLWGLWLTWSAGLGVLAGLTGMIGIEATKRAARCPRCGGVPPSLAGW